MLTDQSNIFNWAGLVHITFIVDMGPSPCSPICIKVYYTAVEITALVRFEAIDRSLLIWGNLRWDVCFLGALNKPSGCHFPPAECPRSVSERLQLFSHVLDKVFKRFRWVCICERLQQGSSFIAGCWSNIF